MKFWNIVNVCSKAVLGLAVSIDGKSTSKSNGCKNLDASFTDVTKCSCTIHLGMSFACNWHRAQKLLALNLYLEALQRLWACFSSYSASICSCGYVTMSVLHLDEGKKSSWPTLRGQGFVPSCSEWGRFWGPAVNRRDTSCFQTAV